MEINLSEAVEKQLKKLYKEAKSKTTAIHINIVLLFNKGFLQKDIASTLLISENTVGHWIQKFKSSITIEQWLHNNYKSYWGKLNSFQIAQLKNHIKDNIIIDLKQLTAYTKEQFNISYSVNGMNSLVHSLGFSFKQLNLFPSKIDVLKQKEFVEEYTTINNNLKDDEEIFFIDGVHPQHNTKAVKAWIQKGSIKYIKSNTGRNRVNLNGAYNPNNQDVIIREDYTINAQSTIKLFEQIQDEYKKTKTIYIFSDNARYYKCKLVTEYLKTSRIKLIFLPPYSPNLNLIERLWKFMRKKVINVMYYPNFESFKNAIRNFFSNINNYKDDIRKFIGNKFQIIEATI